MNWNKIRRWNSMRAVQRARAAANMTPADRIAATNKRWSATDVRRWILDVEPEADAKRVTLKVDGESIVLACMNPIPPYDQSLNPLYQPFRVGSRDMTPAAFNVLETRVLEQI